jgi:hypothetical protein
MTAFAPVTDADLARARRDPGFRQKLLTEHLDSLVTALNALRGGPRAADTRHAEHIREGVDLAMKLSNLLHELAETFPGAQARTRL